MPRTRSEKVAIGFMIVWLTLWAAGMLIVLWAFGGAVLQGEVAAILFMAVWLAAAAFAFYMGARRLRGLVLYGREPRTRRGHAWKDGAVDRRRP